MGWIASRYEPLRSDINILIVDDHTLARHGLRSY
jgi:hypothetical protein